MAALAAAAFTCIVTAQSALADGTDPAVVTPITGESPLAADCGLPEGDGYVLNPDTEVQPMVAADPKRPGRLVAVYQQDRWSKYGGNGTGVVLSDDNGATWKRSANQPAFSRCDGGKYDVTTDHWVTMTPSGTALAAAFSLSRTGEETAIVVSRSGDGGEHWEAPVTLGHDDDPRYFNDRPAITADPYHPGTVYAVWDRVDTQPSGEWVQPVYLAKSTDDGRTWTSRKVYDFPANSGAIGTELVPMADGTLLIGMHQETNTSAATQVIRSTDGGETWSEPTLDVPAPFAVGVKIPDPDDSGDPVRNATLPLLAAQPDGKVVNAVWQSQDADGTFHAAYARSTDSGKTWSKPVNVDKTPTGSAAVPAIAVAPGGTVAITYYDFRNNTSAATLPTDFWAVTCTTDCTKPGSWRERHIEGPFDARKVPPTSVGRLLGDYTGLVASNSAFVAVYGVATGDADNPVDLHSATFYK
ncbi:exo-alpha-sialidase [Actinomadura sp. NAK00032]|uniref:sialidase family protein n=1 Tax=Actinomadura sp. NAK00032 TaxID=2742128 RepID=UPI0015921EE1|nr:sialidase family protein [Actinomadura sp. NAK00032]QKW38382.1 exo-alpha-sialidase [Actinomadura sp. NAK00032]